MSQRTASVVSLLLSLLLLLIFAVLTLIFEMIAMNGATQSQGATALGISLTCLSTGAILLGMLAWKMAAILITRYNLHPILAVTLTVAFGLLVSGMVSVVSLLFSLPLAGIR